MAGRADDKILEVAGLVPKRRVPYILWGVAALIVGVGGMLGILTFAGIALLPSAPLWLGIPVPVLGQGAHGSVVTASVSWFAGTVALYTYFLNRDQKDLHLRAQLNDTREFESTRNLQAREFEDKRERRERVLAELQRIEAEFAALAEDFASPYVLARVNAAIGLGELARRPDPRRVGKDEDVLVDNRPAGNYIGTDGQPCTEWPPEWRSKKTERNYPYFMRVAPRLAAALYLWEDVPARAQALRVLREMGEWAKDGQTDEPLLHGLANHLAEANRTVWAMVCTVAQGCPDLKGAVAKLIVYQLPSGADLARVRESLAADLKRGFAGRREPEGDGDGSLKLKDEWNKLSTVSDELATTLRQLSAPPEPLDEDTAAWRERLRDRRGLNLDGVRMYGAVVRGSKLDGARCPCARFDGADFSEASFVGADCHRASFADANCSGARFAQSNCWVASFAAAICTDASFRWSHCPSARFEGAACERADFYGASISGASFGQRGGEVCFFAAREWEQADFLRWRYDPSAKRFVRTDYEDTYLKNWLEAQWPKPE